MSRIGNKPIFIPGTIKFEVKNDIVTITGPKGTLQQQILPEITLEQEGDTIHVRSKKNGSTRANAFRGMTRSLINNMIIGSQTGFKKILYVEGVGYRVNISEKKLSLSVGYSNQVDFILPPSVSASVSNNQIVLECNDKGLLGETAAKIRNIRRPEPYKGKGIKYEGEHITRKAGKTAGKK